MDPAATELPEAGITVLPHRTHDRRALMRLAVLAFGFFAAFGAGLALAGMLAERTLPSSTFAPFGGWQLDAMAGGLALFVLALLAAIWRAMRRRHRALDASPYRRALMLTVFLPGVFVGALIGDPMSAAVSWASDHTTAAQQARADAHRLRAEDAEGPPVLASGGTAARLAIARRLLQPPDLGRGWFDAQRPSAAEAPVPATAGMYGAIVAVQTRLQQARWSGAAWLPQHLIVEGMLRFRCAQDARRYLATAEGHSVVPTRIEGLSVDERGLGDSSALRSALFQVGADLFSVSIDVTATGAPTAADFAGLVSKAVRASARH